MAWPGFLEAAGGEGACGQYMKRETARACKELEKKALVSLAAQPI